MSATCPCSICTLREALNAAEVQCDRYEAALEQIAGHFLPGDERRTYAGPAETLDMIREEARGALASAGCPCVGTPEQQECPHA